MSHQETVFEPPEQHPCPPARAWSTPWVTEVLARYATSRRRRVRGRRRVAGDRSEVTATYTGSGIFAASTSTATLVEHVARADVKVALVASPTSQTSGGTVTYTLTVTNAGPTAAYGVQASMTLPAGARATSTVVSSSPTASAGTAFPGQPF